MEQFELLKRSNPLNTPKQRTTGTQAKDGWKEMGCEERKAAVHEEMKRVNQLPATSAYATHRMRVLNKILQILSIPRTTSQDEELELLFAGLSI